MAKTAKTIKVKQTASIIGATKVQRATMLGLGLKKMNAEKYCRIRLPYAV